MFGKGNLLTTKCSIFINLMRFIHKNHYEILNLKRNCTPKEIKSAFVSLSKKYHPDMNNDKNSHNKFIEIVTAYNVLSKPDSRIEYDLGLSNPSNNFTKRHADVSSTRGFSRRQFMDEEYAKYYYDAHYNPYRRRNVEENLTKKKNILLGCVAVMLFGAYLQFLTVRATYQSFLGKRSFYDHEESLMSRIHNDRERDSKK